MGKLFIVATPIGNLEDMTKRAIRVLSEADLVLAEDTRQTRKLFDKYKIKTPLKRFDAKAEAKGSEKVIKLLEEGKNIALVSDAGTPGVSDPGAILVSTVRKQLPEAQIIPIPGPSSLTAALSVSGLKPSEFLFLGFLPHKKGRETIFREINETKRAVVFFESPHRLLKTLVSLQDFLPKDRKIIIFREITKIYEEMVEGTARIVFEYFKNSPEKIKGEFVVMVKEE